MNENDPMTRSGAKWCEKHNRWECSAKKADHHAIAIRGMAYCRHHVGRSTAVAKALGEANLLAWSTEAAPADLQALDPGQVVLGQLRVAVLRADLYGLMLRWQLETEEESGLVGATFATASEGQRVQTGEQVRGLARLEAEWRDRAVRFAKTAHDMGIAEREIRVTERTGQQLASVMRAVLDRLGLTQEQQLLAVQVVPEEFRRLGDGVVAGEVVA